MLAGDGVPDACACVYTVYVCAVTIAVVAQKSESEVKREIRLPLPRQDKAAVTTMRADRCDGSSGGGD